MNFFRSVNQSIHIYIYTNMHTYILYHNRLALLCGLLPGLRWASNVKSARLWASRLGFSGCERL